MPSCHHNFCRDTQSSRKSNRAPGGSVTLEFILTLPILLIVLFAVVQFGMFFASTQQVALACRVGALEASQTDLTTTIDGDVVPAAITDAVEAQLSVSGIAPCAVILEHNVRGGEQTLLTTYTACDCAPPADALPAPSGAGARSVRLTVCVPMKELTPNCLAGFGFDLTDYLTTCSSTFRYELSTP
jgi:hypothetical protein